ncbi:hypothetical protein BJV74DRAFT_799472 [Russula compacta]|nr:hypothetical protein BJV74DRAFT_799472 [Russula compacta]
MHLCSGPSTTRHRRRAIGQLCNLHRPDRVSTQGYIGQIGPLSLAPCTHLFHTECFEHWLAIKVQLSQQVYAWSIASPKEGGLLGLQAVARDYKARGINVIAMSQFDMTTWVKNRVREEVNIVIDFVDPEFSTSDNGRHTV